MKNLTEQIKNLAVSIQAGEIRHDPESSKKFPSQYHDKETHESLQKHVDENKEKYEKIIKDFIGEEGLKITDITVVQLKAPEKDKLNVDVEINNRLISIKPKDRVIITFEADSKGSFRLYIPKIKD